LEVGIVWIDPLVTVAISLYIFRAAFGVVKTTVDILMQRRLAGLPGHPPDIEK
jgi:divalent metal cation (Fe/Co/Zn/Cd) transporter